MGVPATPISSSAYDTFIGDLSTEITNSVNVQGTAPMLAPLNMGAFKIINAAAPVAATDVAIKSYVDSAVSPGFIMGYALNTAAPAGWLACNGASLSTTTYANLFAAIGYNFGGSGANFNVPDRRGVFMRGFDNGRGLDFQGTRGPNVFQASYINNHQHAVADPTHAHGVFDTTHTHSATTGGHSHTASDSGHQHAGVAVIGSGTFALGSPGFLINSGSTGVGFANISVGAVGNLGVTVFGSGTGINATDARLTGVTVGNVNSGNVNFAGTETTVQNYPVLWCIKY